MFKVGDIITGLPSSDREYGLTNSRCNMEVVEMRGTTIKVRILDLPSYVGEMFHVESDFFRLSGVERPEEKTAVERKIAFMYKRFEER